jgi:chromosome segregation ATPase
MVTLEQVKLLETKVAKAIDYVKKLSEENSLLRGKLDDYRNRIDELEVLIRSFKEDQGRIEAGIISALDRLNQFEDAMEREITDPSQDNPNADGMIKEDPPLDASPLLDTVEENENDNRPPEGPSTGSELDIF